MGGVFQEKKRYLRMAELTKQDLIDFEEKIAAQYGRGKIGGPIHLRNGNEQQLIEIFKSIYKEDYVFSTWGSHLHALLKGVPPHRIEAEINCGRSISLMFPEYRFFTSAIVGGICPIATGVAWSIKQNRKNNHVYTFIGDMASFTGAMHESLTYATNFDLPITFVIEDNEKSVETPTYEAWNCKSNPYKNHPKVKYYQYELTYPHSGTGKFIEF